MGIEGLPATASTNAPGDDHSYSERASSQGPVEAGWASSTTSSEPREDDEADPAPDESVLDQPGGPEPATDASASGDAAVTAAPEVAEVTGAEPEESYRSRGFFRWLDRLVARRPRSDSRRDDAPPGAEPGPGPDGDAEAESAEASVPAQDPPPSAESESVGQIEGEELPELHSPSLPGMSWEQGAGPPVIAEMSVTAEAEVPADQPMDGEAASEVVAAEEPARAELPSSTPGEVVATVEDAVAEMEVGLPVDDSMSVEPSAPVDEGSTAETAASAEGPVAAAEVAAPVEAPAPVDEGSTAETVAPAEEPVAAAEVAAPVEVPAPVDARPSRRALRPAWPSHAELAPRRRSWTPLVVGALVVAVLFTAGWGLGRLQGPDADTGKPIWARALSAVGLGGAHYTCRVTSGPAGALISVDGKSLGRLTPATIELTPGSHRVGLSLPDLGSAFFPVRGERGDRATLEAPLWGSLEVRPPPDGATVQVAVDGQVRGFAPLEVKNLGPGAHQVEFSSVGLPPISQTVQIRVSQRSEVDAHLLQSPGSGVIDVRATFTDDRGVEDLDGATVWVDGERRGTTPLSLELPRGPHSIRAAYRGEEAPIQVLNLPGGNQRFVSFQFGSGVDNPALALLDPPAPMPRDRPTVLSVALEGVAESEVREMWMHVRTPQGTWRRYPMAVMSAPGGSVGVAVFPLAMLDEQGRAPFYVSAATNLGDEYFTEIQNPPRNEAPRPRS